MGRKRALEPAKVVRDRLLRATEARLDLVEAELLAPLAAQYPEHREAFYREYAQMREAVLRRAADVLDRLIAEAPSFTIVAGGKAQRAISGEVAAGLARLIAIPGGPSGK